MSAPATDAVRELVGEDLVRVESIHFPESVDLDALRETPTRTLVVVLTCWLLQLNDLAVLAHESRWQHAAEGVGAALPVAAQRSEEHPAIASLLAALATTVGAGSPTSNDPPQRSPLGSLE